MRTNRRQLLKKLAIATAAAPVLGSTLGAKETNAASAGSVTMTDLRGTTNAGEHGLIPGAIDDQSKQLQSILDKAAIENKPVFLPPGNYFVSNIILPKNTRLMGVPGASRLVYTGGGHMLLVENGEHIELTGIVVDGANRSMHTYAEALVRIVNTKHAVIDNCQILGSFEKAVHIERSQGRIERCKISGAAGDCGIYSFENKGLSIINNEVTNCSNGGILVHRWENGADGTIVSGNRITKIGASNGGTGQWGNGINVFRAANVIVNNNYIADCAFSAIRGNAANNIQMTGNTCLRSGETAIYSEFEFNGSVINSNIIDGGSRGISIANFLQGGHLSVVGNNLVRNIVATGPYVEESQPFGEAISVEADVAVTGNVIENAATFGIMLGWGPYLRDVVTSNNVIRRVDRGIYVSVVEGSGAALISDNIITDAKKGGIFGYEWNNLMTKDMSVVGSDAYSHLSIMRNKVS